MRRLAVIGIIVLSLLGGKAAYAAKQTTPFWQGGASQSSPPVEQESPNFFFCGGSAGPIYCSFDPSTWVYNNTPCIWDVDEYSIHDGYGDLPSGQRTTSTNCMISDGYDNYGQDDHIAVGKVVSSSPNLVVTMTNNLGFSQTAVPVLNGKVWNYLVCTIDRTPGPYPIVDGSNGGTGIRVDYTLSITNSSTRTARSTSARFQLGYDLDEFLHPDC